MDDIRAFERDLDAALGGRAVYRYDADLSLALAANLCEATSEKLHIGNDSSVARGSVILAPRLVSGCPGESPNVRSILEDLIFAGHYYMLREYFYYTYNAPNSIAWSFSGERVDIRFADRTIPRQFFTAHNDAILHSREIFADFTAPSEILRLLKGEPEGQITPNVTEALRLIETEVNYKLRGYFSTIDLQSSTDLGGYTYAQFIAAYRVLLAKALYHRYFTRLNQTIGAIFIGENELLDALEEDASLDRGVSTRILRDLVFDQEGVATRTDSSYFSLWREGAGARRIVLRPHHFSIEEGLVNLLRVVAHRRPKTFLKNLSIEISKGFVRRVKTAFEAQGFICRSEVPLRDIDPTLPDIDLLVISEEPTLGFVVFVCELKSPIPPRWAKDQLRALNADGISKGFKQVEALKRFIQTDAGVEFLVSLLPKFENPSHFDGLVVAVDHLIITSDNAGMFFGKEATKVVNVRMLERLLKRSDGDMAFVQHVLATYNEYADEAMNTNVIEFAVGSRLVSYEGVSGGPLLDFPEVQWRSSPTRQEMIDEFIASGSQPFDVFRDLAEANKDQDDLNRAGSRNEDAPGT